MVVSLIFKGISFLSDELCPARQHYDGTAQENVTDTTNYFPLLFAKGRGLGGWVSPPLEQSLRKPSLLSPAPGPARLIEDRRAVSGRKPRWRLSLELQGGIACRRKRSASGSVHPIPAA